MAEIDLSGQSPAQSPQPSNLPPTSTPRGDSDPDILLRRDVHDAIERRWMRLIVSSIALLIAILFLVVGLCFALKVGNGLLQAKSNIVSALTQTQTQKDVCELKGECSESKSESVKPVATKSVHLDKNDKAMGNLSTDWLSASSLIAIVAFILGVGLTLILTLIKSAFHHPTDKNQPGQRANESIELATPLSELIMGIVDYIKGKLSK
ncbi:hypothetical protein [Escherichia coli]|nr:hypothetical protein [Escherichia coli]MDF8985237.1 hypothetical protein [Escherichia coli]MEB7474863.1 hypothetical protein [Escherichia coli]MED9843463.1 hypothetical protein [Escherichia coli]WNT55230.1 hypothetical protein PWR57_00020 [Escherichia coli O121]